MTRYYSPTKDFVTNYTLQDYFSTKVNSECILFPTYAKRSTKNTNEWTLKVKGWAMSHNCPSTRQRMMMSITKSVAGKSSASPTSSEAFEERFKYFLASSQRYKNFLIQAVGVSTYEMEQPLPTFFDQNFLPSFYTPPVTPPEEEYPIRPRNPLSSVFDHANPYQNVPVDQDNMVQLKTSSSGFFSGEFSLPHDNVLNWAQAQKQCDARLIRIRSSSTDNEVSSPTHGIVNLVEPCGISIISDIDDTIKDTRILSGARTVLSKTFFEAPKDVDGMADVYMSWYSQGASFHYVSNSPFQLIPMLDQFIRHYQFPPGSMHLRDESSLFSRLVETPGQAKREAILEIIQDFPQRLFVLVGDSGEIDLEIYTKIASEYPDRILKIFIRDVTTPSEKKKKTQRPNQLSSIFYQSSFLSSFSKKSSEDLPASPQSSLSSSSSKSTELKKILKSSLGIGKATAALTEYAVEPHLTGHQSSALSEEDERCPHQVSTAEACTQLYERVEKARLQIPHTEIILFQNSYVLNVDSNIRNALWKNWDNMTESSR
ncbi:unnamed protein product [Rhizopus stolonifer]